ncbi:MAG TPA: VOC family protein [Candidatus Acidoferrales bacterium]|nr:VOC family protein [Candidatus Acidoferrales bacterium]
MALDVEKLRKLAPPSGMPFQIRRLGHVVLRVTDLERSVEFYTQVLGFKVSDIYPEEMQPGGFAFLRCNTDHHCLALVGDAPGEAKHHELHHMAFEVGTLEEVFRVRERLREHNIPLTFEGRRRAGCQISVEFEDPDRHTIEVYWGIDQIGTDGRARPASEWKGVRSLEEAVANPVSGQDIFFKR